MLCLRLRQLIPEQMPHGFSREVVAGLGRALPARRGASIAAALILAILYLPSFAQAQNPPTLSSLTVSPEDIYGFSADTTAYAVGVANTVTQATISATATDGATVRFSVEDADTNADGHQVNLETGLNTITITVTAQDSSTVDYTIRIGRGSSDEFGWKAADDLDGLFSAGNRDPVGIWGDDAGLFWVADSTDDYVYAYRTDGSEDTSRGFTLDAGNSNPTGIWSDGTLLWVADAGFRLFAYQLSDGTREPSRDIRLTFEVLEPRDIWSDGDTIWVLDKYESLFAYQLADGAPVPSRDIALSAGEATAMWSTGTILWTVNDDSRNALAYNLGTGVRDADKDFTLPSEVGDTYRGLWADGEIMWVVSEEEQSKVYSVNLGQADATLSSLTVGPKDIYGFSADTTAYAVGVANTVTQATISATATESVDGATVLFSVDDADTNANGHQVDLSVGLNTIVVTGVGKDGLSTQDYTLRIGRGETVQYGWRADDDLDGLVAAGNTTPHGIWGNDSLLWTLTIPSSTYIRERTGLSPANTTWMTRTRIPPASGLTARCCGWGTPLRTNSSRTRLGTGAGTPREISSLLQGTASPETCGRMATPCGS